MAQVSYGTITITDTNDISRIYVEYCRSTSNQLSGTTVPNITRAWGETTPPWVDGEYIWQRAVVEKSGTLEKTYGTPVCISGEKGETGQQGPQGGTGAAGRSLDSTETKYAQVAANSTEAQVKALIESRWTLNVPSYNSSLPEYWVRVTNVYSNPTETQKIYYKDNGITDAVKTSAEANTTAGQAKTQAAAAEGKADSAASTANSANTKATNALNIANGTSQHFWWIAEDTSTTGGTISAGAYITDIAKDTFKTNPSGYGNLLLRSDGVYLNVGLQTLASFKSDALTFYNSAGTELGKFGSTGLEMSGTLNIKGGGRIGQDSDNYWEFGDNKSYNDEDSAYLIGRGTASIQLGETGHWRLDKNRIHAGWYQLDDKSNSTPAGSLHFDTGADGNATYYWDYGMHYPDKAGNGNNKFLYIRRSNDTTSTTLSTMKGRIDDDTWWTYKFYIDGNGNVHAPGFYIGDSTTPIGGGAGTVAERLTQGYGSTTQPIYIQSNGVPAAIDYTIQSSVPQNAVFTALSTSNPGYVAKAPNSTSQFLRGDATWAAVTKSNVGLGNVENVALSSWAGSSSLTTTKVGTLAEAATRGVDTSISATSTSTKLPTSAAVANLVKQYLPLTGGNVTGAVTFGSSVSADELTVGDLVVNGSASFTNNLQANTINGVAVGSNPKFTDTVTTVTVTGSGNAITGASASGGAVTLTKGTTFPTGSGTNGYLTKWTGTNTIGNGPALGSDTTKFLNNKGEWAVPAGTGLTSVGASGSGGITISGSPITTSGTIAIGLNLSTAINGLGEGTSPATREDYIVAQYAGGGTTTTSYHRRKLSNIFAALNSSDITTALGYTPYNATNPNGYTSNTGTVTSIATSSPITGGTITGSGTIGHATSGVGNAVTTAGLYKFKYDTYGHITGVASVAKADITGLGIPAQDTTYSNASTTTAGLMSAADKKKLDNIQVDSSGQAVAANVAGRWGIDVTFNSNNVAQVGHANSAITASNTQAAKTTASVTSTQLAFGDVINFPYVAYDTYGHITSKTNLYFKMPAAPSSTGTADKATNDSDGNPINTTYIKKSIGTAAGDIIYWSASGTPTRLAKGSNGQFLTLSNGIPAWTSALVTGVKGNSESNYRTGQVNITATNIGLGNVENKSSATIRSELTDSNVTTALGYTPSHNVSLGFHNDFDRCVIALCETSATNTGINSWSNGILTRQRDNGLVPTKVAYVTFNGAYSTAYSAYYSLLCNHENTSTDARGSIEGFRACTFTYNSKRYAGLEFYQVQASTFFYTQLAGTFTPFMVPYYNTSSSTVKNSEINNSLVYGTSTLFRQSFDAQTIAGHTVGINVPSNAKFTDTWNALSTSQAGYVSTAPNDTAKFLRGDASWAQVSSANLSDIRLTWSSSVSTTDWILAHDAAATGTPLFRAMSPTNLKTTMSLNNVENKSSATIRGELTSSNVTTALGYTPVNKAGDTMTGTLTVNVTSGAGNYNEGIRINKANNNYSTLTLGGASGSTSGIGDGIWWIGTNQVSYPYRLMIAHNGSGATGTYFYVPNSSTVTPLLRLGTSGTITSGNMDAVNGGTVYTAISNLSGSYVSLTGNEGILGTKVFGSGTSYGSVTNKTAYTQKANINYNAMLDALVFSFA